MIFDSLKPGDKFTFLNNKFIYLKYDNCGHRPPQNQITPDNYINMKTGETFLAHKNESVIKLEI